jgi:hypothetical protein
MVDAVLQPRFPLVRRLGIAGVAAAAMLAAAPGVLAGNLSNEMVFCASNAASSVYTTKYTNGAWPATTVSGTITTYPNWIVGQPMTGGRVIVGALDSSANGALNIGLTDSVGVATYTNVNSNLAGSTTRPFDISTDATYSTAMIVYYDHQSTNKVVYRTHNGTTLSAETATGFGNIGTPDYIRLYPKNSGSEVMMLAQVSAKLYAAVWSGSSWSATTVLNNNMTAGTTPEKMSGAYEANSGRFIAVYSDNSNNPGYSIYTPGTGWGAQQSMGNCGGQLQYSRAVSRPGTNEIYWAGEVSNAQGWVAQWTGSAWSGLTNIASFNPGTPLQRYYDIACSPDGTTVIVVYRDNGATNTTVYYRTWTGAAWSAETAGMNMGSSVQIVAARGWYNGKVLITASDNGQDQYAATWDGTTFGNVTRVQASLGGTAAYERFALVPCSGSYTLKSWQQVAP